LVVGRRIDPRRLFLANESTLLTVSLLVEEDAEVAARVPFPLRTEEEIRKAILAAVTALLSDRPDVRVEWSSLSLMPLDGTEGYGRCVVCNRWVFDAEVDEGERRGGVSPGAMVDGRFRCDEHLPTGHPLCFAGRGYDGPVPESVQ
jgi:hypothetical protein